MKKSKVKFPVASSGALTGNTFCFVGANSGVFEPLGINDWYGWMPDRSDQRGQLYADDFRPLRAFENE